MSATVLTHDDDDVHLFDYFACFHGHNFFNIIYLALSGFPWGSNREESPLRT